MHGGKDDIGQGAAVSTDAQPDTVGDRFYYCGSRNERQELQLWLLRRGARAFASYTVVGAGIAAAGAAVSFSYNTRARTEIIGGSVFAGAWLAWFGLGISKRLHAGPIARLAAHNQADNPVSASGSDTEGT